MKESLSGAGIASVIMPKPPSSWTLHRTRSGHGRLGRVETGPPARALPIGTQEHADTHMWEACAPLQKSKSSVLLV